MTYDYAAKDGARLLTRTLTGVADFSGRSRRTEVFHFWIACVLMALVINAATVAFRGTEASVLVRNVLQLLFLIPMFSLFVRRVHDQGRSTWWALLLLCAVLFSIPQMIAELRGDLEPIIEQRLELIDALAAILAIAVVALCLVPGTAGPNRYGPDPRIEEA